VGANGDTVEERLSIAGRDIVLVRPREWESLLTEEAFEREELLPYWAHLWGSAVALAEAVAGEDMRGRRVLELGCGLGLPSIAAAQAGAYVTATDWSAHAVRAAAANAAMNGVQVRTVVADWNDPGALVDQGPWDLVLAADVLYERPKARTLLDLLPRLADTVMLAEPGRAPAQAFFDGTGAHWHLTEVSTREDPRVTVHRLRRRQEGMEPAATGRRAADPRHLPGGCGGELRRADTDGPHRPAW